MGDDLIRLNAASAPESIQWQQRDESAELIAVPTTQEQAKRIKDIAQDLGFNVQVENTKVAGENFRIIAVRALHSVLHVAYGCCVFKACARVESGNPYSPEMKELFKNYHQK